MPILTSACQNVKVLSVEGLSEAGAAWTDLVLEVFRVNGLLLEAGDALTLPVGLSSARWQVLGVVEHGPTPVPHIARTMGLTRQAVQQTVNALVQDGFVQLTDNPHHRRAKLVSLTPKGQDALAFVARRQAAWANQLGAPLDLRRLQSAVQLLREVRQGLEHDQSERDPER